MRLSKAIQYCYTTFLCSVLFLLLAGALIFLDKTLGLITVVIAAAFNGFFGFLWVLLTRIKEFIRKEEN